MGQNAENCFNNCTAYPSPTHGLEARCRELEAQLSACQTQLTASQTLAALADENDELRNAQIEDGGAGGGGGREDRGGLRRKTANLCPFLKDALHVDYSDQVIKYLSPVDVGRL